MYLDWFGLKECPFGVTPDSRYFYLGQSQERALSCLTYGIEQRQGFVMVTGEVGTGKTLLCRTLLDRLGETTSTALIMNPCFEPQELLRVIVADFGVEPATGEKAGLIEALNRFLLEKLRQGARVVLVIDEAQTLPEQSLEEIRLLSNLETDREKLLQIVLVGQPELLAKLAQAELRQLNQRITVRCDLEPLEPREIRRYVAHRLLVAAGRERPDLFSSAGLLAVSRLSRGYPRDINALCDRALLAAYAGGRKCVGAGLVLKAHRDLRKTPPRRHLVLLRWVVPSLLIAAAGWVGFRQAYPEKRPPPPATAAAPAVLAAPVIPPANPGAAGSRPSAAAPVQPQPVPRPDAEVASDGNSLSASLAALATRWNMERLAGEVRQWQFVSLKDRALPAFFLKSGLARTHGMELLALPATMRSLNATDLPCLASEKTGDGYRFVVLSSLQKTSAVVLDPVAGRRVLPAAEWLAQVRGSFFFLVPKDALAPALRPGDRGPAVLGLQKGLRRAGFLRGTPGGTYGRETKDAVLALQHRHGIEADGVAGIETRLRLLRIGNGTMPSLRGAP